MKIFVPFEEALLDDLLAVGEAIVPFKIEFDRGRVSWDHIELVEDAPAPRQHTANATSAVE
ncbi:MAG: hypothetical protein ACR2PZ_14630 [Pseudomonadales bacterium]